MNDILATKLYEALHGSRLLDGVLVIENERQVTLAKARQQKIDEAHRSLVEAQKYRFTVLKNLVKEVFPNRSDILAHAVARKANGSSRLWELASEPKFEATKMALMFAGTSPAAEKQAKMLING